eukprot:jgi/Ulvmu1/868/UM100_0020.1
MIGSVFVLALASVGIVSQAEATGRERRPRGDRPVDTPRVRGERGERGARPMDPPRMRDGMYGDEAGAYGGEAGAYGDMDMDMDMDVCDTSLLDVAASTPELSTLNAAIAAAGLDEFLMDPTLELTVLAPNNDAFAAIPEDTLNALLAAPEDLASILSLHAIEAVVFAGDLMDGMVVTTLSAGDLVVGITDAGVTFTSPGGVVATVVKADIAVCKSVVHIIDSVLLP